MDAAGLLGLLVSAPSASSWLGGTWAVLVLAVLVAGLAAMGGLLLYRRGRRASDVKVAPKPDPAHTLKERLRRRLAEPAGTFAPFACIGPSVGAGEMVDADFDAAAKSVLPEAEWRASVAKHILRQRLNGHAPADEPAGSEAARWRQLGALALVDNIEDALAAYTRAADLAPDDADLKLLVGFLYLRTGRLEVAETIFRRLLEASAGGDGAEADPGHSAVKYRAGTMLGDVLLAKGDQEAALEVYKTACEEVMTLAEREPGIPRWQRDASVAHDRIGDLLLACGQAEPALASFRKSLEICKALADSEPDKAARQHDLSVAHDRVGEALALQGDLDGALESYCAGLALAEAAARLAPACADWRWDVSASHERIGDVLSAKGALADALAAYRLGLEIAEEMAATEPTRVDWQRDLAASCHKVGLLAAQLGREAEAREALEQGRAIIARLAEIARHQAQWRADLVMFNAALKSLGE